MQKKQTEAYHFDVVGMTTKESTYL